MVLLALGVDPAAGQGRGPGPFRGLPWGAPAGPADPLEPWSLGERAAVPVPSTTPERPGIALPVPTDPVTPRDPRLDQPPPAIYGSDSTAVDAIPVVVLRHIYLESPHLARQLRELFDAGVHWADARTLLKLESVPEYVREYPLEDLAASMLQEVAALPDSAWSSGHPWRGRTMFYQVLARVQRSRAGLPQLGEGLGDSERGRLSQLGPRLRQPVLSGLDSDSANDEDYVKVALVKQEQAVYPPAATTDGAVVLDVYVGRQHDVVKIEVISSTDPVFEDAARQAARLSEYRSATRNGIPEPGTIRLEYPFQVPQDQSATGQP